MSRIDELGEAGQLEHRAVVWPVNDPLTGHPRRFFGRTDLSLCAGVTIEHAPRLGAVSIRPLTPRQHVGACVIQVADDPEILRRIAAAFEAMAESARIRLEAMMEAP